MIYFRKGVKGLASKYSDEEYLNKVSKLYLIYDLKKMGIIIKSEESYTVEAVRDIMRAVVRYISSR